MHPEDYCQECGSKNPVWFTDNATWNKVMGNGYGILCPNCFISRAHAQDPTLAWKIQIE
jgi:hypothetical protein